MNPLVAAGADMAWHGFKRFISVLVWTLVIAGLGWAVYAGIIRPTTKPNATTKQEGKRDNYSNTYSINPRFGCMHFDMRGKKDDNNNRPVDNSGDTLPVGRTD